MKEDIFRQFGRGLTQPPAMVVFFPLLPLFAAVAELKLLLEGAKVTDSTVVLQKTRGTWIFVRPYLGFAGHRNSFTGSPAGLDIRASREELGVAEISLCPVVKWDFREGKILATVERTKKEHPGMSKRLEESYRVLEEKLKKDPLVLEKEVEKPVFYETTEFERRWNIQWYERLSRATEQPWFVLIEGPDGVRRVIPACPECYGEIGVEGPTVYCKSCSWQRGPPRLRDLLG